MDHLSTHTQIALNMKRNIMEHHPDSACLTDMTPQERHLHGWETIRIRGWHHLHQWQTSSTIMRTLRSSSVKYRHEHGTSTSFTSNHQTVLVQHGHIKFFWLARHHPLQELGKLEGRHYQHIRIIKDNDDVMAAAKWILSRTDQIHFPSWFSYLGSWRSFNSWIIIARLIRLRLRTPTVPGMGSRSTEQPTPLSESQRWEATTTITAKILSVQRECAAVFVSRLFEALVSPLKLQWQLASRPHKPVTM